MDSGPEQVRNLLARPRFGPGHQLAVEFLTDPEAYAALLPPPLEPAPRPLVIASVGRWASNCIGTYTGGSITLLARHEGVEAGHPVGMWMDSEPAVLFGREVFGEPKKLAHAGIERSDHSVHAWIDRHGTRLLDLRATLDEEQPVGDFERRTFNVRARTAPDGDGLAEDALLTLSTFATTTTLHLTGPGQVSLAATPLDPVCGLPVLEVLGATYQHHTMLASCRGVTRIPADAFWPWHLLRNDDPRLLPRVPVVR